MRSNRLPAYPEGSTLLAVRARCRRCSVYGIAYGTPSLECRDVAAKDRKQRDARANQGRNSKRFSVCFERESRQSCDLLWFDSSGSTPGASTTFTREFPGRFLSTSLQKCGVPWECRHRVAARLRVLPLVRGAHSAWSSRSWYDRAVLARL